MKHLVRQYLDERISRRQFVAGLTASGLTSLTAESMAQSLISVPSSAGPSNLEMSDSSGLGGALLVQQLKAAGVEFIFFNPSSGDAPVFDALVDEKSIQLIKGIQEGAVIAMADGYARVSGKTGVAVVAEIGLPNAMTQMQNTFKDRIPLLVVVAAFGRAAEGRDEQQNLDFQDSMLGPLTKWHWTTRSAEEIPEFTRRALKFASTPPGGPVFLAISEDALRTEASSRIIDQRLFDVSMRVRPDPDMVERAARLLIEARSPLLTVGDEVTLCHGEREVVELAELLGLPAAGEPDFGSWSKPFPTRHPLYLGTAVRVMPYPGEIDVHLNMGSRFDELAAPRTRLISIRQDPMSLARNEPVDLPMVADVRLATRDLIDAIKSMATATRLQQIASERATRTHAYTHQRAQLLQAIVASVGTGPAIRGERLALELEEGLARDTIYVSDCDSGRIMHPLMSFGGDDKTFIGTGPASLGWAVGAGLGAKLARPDRPVVSILGDGSMLFGGPQPLWSMARYQAPVTTIIYNNRSYDNERNRIWGYTGGEQFKQGRDMTCYNGEPDVDFAKAAQAFGVEGETVHENGQIAAALERAHHATVEGRPYLLDVLVERDGAGAASAWYPRFSIAAQRTRKV
jgi:benzoylformate decarboxylase